MKVSLVKVMSWSSARSESTNFVNSYLGFLEFSPRVREGCIFIWWENLGFLYLIIDSVIFPFTQITLKLLETFIWWRILEGNKGWYISENFDFLLDWIFLLAWCTRPYIRVSSFQPTATRYWFYSSRLWACEPHIRFRILRSHDLRYPCDVYGTRMQQP